MQQEENKTVDIDTSGPGAEIELENDSKETETPEVETSAEETKTEVVEEQPEETKVESKEEAPKEDELKDYSESVQKRIAKLTKKWREAERQKDEALTYAKSVLTEKEKAEHATIVDLLRNDLSEFAKKVRVEKYRYYEVIKANNKQVGQMSSEISGELPMDYRSRIGDIIYHLTPAGSISGAPKPKTLELIQEIEQQDRGFYTGIAGYFDGDNLDSCVLIRYLEKDGTYRCGGGVTSKSKLKEEYEELIQKMYVPIY